MDGIETFLWSVVVYSVSFIAGIIIGAGPAKQQGGAE